MTTVVRAYDPARDGAGVRACFVELHEHARTLEPGLPAGEEIADAYLARLWERCRSWDGRFFVAEAAGEIAGFVCVWARVPPQEPDDEPIPVAYVSDLVVRASHRRRGLGRRLLEQAEAFARERGAGRIGIGVIAVNAAARELYRALGYDEVHIELRKRLG